MFAGGDYLLREETQEGFFKYEKGGFCRYSKRNQVGAHVRSLGFCILNFVSEVPWWDEHGQLNSFCSILKN